MPVNPGAQRRGGSKASDKSQTEINPSTKSASGLVSVTEPTGKEEDNDGDDFNPDIEDEDDAPRPRRLVGGFVRPGLSRSSGNNINVKIIGIDTSKATLSKAAVTNLDFPMASRAEFFASTRLQDIRSRLSAVVRENATYTFCTDEGAMAASEDISLEAYTKTLSGVAHHYEDSVLVYIVSTTEPPPSQESVLLKPPFQLKFIQMDANPGDALNTGSLHSSAFQGKNPSSMPMGELRRMIGKMSASTTMHIFCSVDGSAVGDELSLSQYLGLDRENVHEKVGTPSIIIRYRKSEAKISAAASKFHGASQDVLAAMEQMRPDLRFKDHSAEEFKVDKSVFRVQEELDASRIAAHNASPVKYTSQMDEADWDAVLRNCSLLYGWRVNKKTGRMERATTPAFRLKVKTSILTPIVNTSQSYSREPEVNPPPPYVRDTEAMKDSDTGSSSLTGSSTDLTKGGGVTIATSDNLVTSEVPTPALTAEDIASVIPTKLGAVPSYAINDQSEIKITTITSQFQESMAKNHFDSTSVEASVSGGYAGYSAGAVGGLATDNSNKQAQTNKSFSKRMVGSYMFPRVSVFLRPEDLEPTPELRMALRLIDETKNIYNLRKLYSTFGHFFCQSVTLGGCLQTTKMVSGTEQVKDTEEKEKFKASLGVAVSARFGIKASAKATHEASDTDANFNRQLNTAESMAFEATGGNTILAADPPAWSASVADFNHWRAIEERELTPMVECIAGMTGYGEVKSWFLRAIPKLSEYYVIPESRILHVRFAAVMQGKSYMHITGRTEQGYLGLNPSHPPKPARMSLKKLPPTQSNQDEIGNIIGTTFNSHTTADIAIVTRQVDVHSNDAMFFPHSVQAPVLMFPSDKTVGTQQDANLMQTLWRFEIAQGYSLDADCLVCVKSCAPIRTAVDKEPQQVDLALTVYRNAQGVFMPAIQSSDEPCYWRLRRLDDTANSSLKRKQESFRYGETFRLTWSFSDQAAGYRDFVDDIYGRRSYTKPAGILEETLCLKMPYPRFEPTSDNSGISLVLHSALTSDPILQSLQVRRTHVEGPGPDSNITYTLYDVPFRVDYVGDDGAGDAQDFMNVVTDGHEERSKESTSLYYPPARPAKMVRGSAMDVIGGGLIGGLDQPFAALVNRVNNLLNIF
ncbi:hypothetical protein E0Z10_g5810 [Xylaria hypoxylon]|uniref:MACPF-like domain-containing protein n=1 Tax=Xylaria hypoxylon TaxID=37992 RepID=A0A4Z0YWV7_9PEZI|nr:hypothetical protein E0Z10_g5810 [Xylaria hypoxylon]